MNPNSFDQDTIAKFQQAKAAGVPDDINYKKAIQYQTSKSQAPPTPEAKPQGEGWASILPLLGGIAGSFIPGAGTVVGGAAGAGLGTLLKQLLNKETINPGEVVKETAFGAGGGLLGKGAGFLGSKIFSKFGSTLADAGSEMGVRALRLNKPQLNNFVTKHGEDVADFLRKENAVGKNVAALREQHIEPLQDQYNTIVKNSGLTVNPEKFQNNVLQKAQEIVDAGGTENAQIADKLVKEAEFILKNSLEPVGHDISAYNNLRKTFASKVNWNNPTKAAEDYAVADVLRKTMIDTADEAGAAGAGGIGLKDIGIKLSKYRDLENFATAQEQLGRGNLPAGITKWLSVLAGTGLGGPAGGAAGFAAGNALNSPEVMRLLANFGIKGGESIANIGENVIPRATSSLERTGIGLATLPGGEAQAMEPTNIPRPSSMEPSSNATPVVDQQTEDLRKILGTLMFSKAKNVSDLKTAFEFMNPDAAKKTKPLSAEQQKLKISGESGISAIAKVEDILKRDPNAPLKSKLPIVKGRSPYAAAANEVKDAFSRIRTGAALTEQEVKFYDSQLPQPFDSAQTINYKLSLFRNLFERVAYGQVSDVPDFAFPTSNNLLQ